MNYYYHSKSLYIVPQIELNKDAMLVFINYTSHSSAITRYPAWKPLPYYLLKLKFRLLRFCKIYAGFIEIHFFYFSFAISDVFHSTINYVLYSLLEYFWKCLNTVIIRKFYLWTYVIVKCTRVVPLLDLSDL